MPPNVHDLTREYLTASTAKPSTGNSFVDLFIAGRAALEQLPGQGSQTAIRPREQDLRIPS